MAGLGSRIGRLERLEDLVERRVEEELGAVLRAPSCASPGSSWESSTHSRASCSRYCPLSVSSRRG